MPRVKLSMLYVAFFRECVWVCVCVCVCVYINVWNVNSYSGETHEF
jgi:hypothetical protein